MFLLLSSQGGCFDPLPQNFSTQQPTATPVSMDPKPPTYTSQFTPAPQAQFPPEVATVGQQGLGFGAPRGAFPGGTAGMGLRPGMTRPQGMGPQLRLPPNQLRLQLQQRLQGPQQVRTGRRWLVPLILIKWRMRLQHSLRVKGLKGWLYYSNISSRIFILILYTLFTLTADCTMHISVLCWLVALC